MHKLAANVLSSFGDMANRLRPHSPFERHPYLTSLAIGVVGLAAGKIIVEIAGMQALDWLANPVRDAVHQITGTDVTTPPTR